MLARNGEGLASAATENQARKFNTGKCRTFKPPTPRTQDAIRAELIGDDECTIAAGITARGNTPILALCRLLIAAGVDPGRGLNVHRGATLCLIVRAIGEAANLTINGKGNGFRKPACAVVGASVVECMEIFGPEYPEAAE
jgi:hypothetical protein